MYRSNIYPKMILLVSFFVLAVSSVFAQPSLEYKLQLTDADTWCVFVRPRGVNPSALTITGSAQVTVVMPLNFGWNGLTSVNGTWAANSIVHGPIENDTSTYVSFGMINEFPHIDLVAGEETMLFCFNRTDACPERIALINNVTDPFLPPNSIGSNPGNEITVFDPVGTLLFEYMGNYSPFAWDCHDCDGDGILNAFEDTDGDGVYDANVEDTNGNGVLDPGEDDDNDGYLDPDASQICNPCDPYHTESASLQLLDTLGVVCYGDLDTACFKVNIDGHWPPYTVNWTDGTNNFSTANIRDGDTICYVPTASVSLEIVSIIDSFGCVLDTALGAPIDIDVHGPISFTVQPRDTTECHGNGAGFGIAAVNAGDGTILYRWQVSIGGGPWTYINDGSVYDDTQTPNMLVANVAGKDTYRYRCEISTTVCDPVYSNPATLRVEGPITVDTHPVDITNCATEDASFTAVFDNQGVVGTMSTVWQYSTNGTVWTDLANGAGPGGATYSNATASTALLTLSGTLNLTGITVAMDGWYFRQSVRTGECAFVYTNAARLNVEGAITVTEHPVDISNCAGNEVNFIADFNNAGASYPADPNLTVTNHYWQINTGSGWVNLDNTSGVYTGISGSNLGASGNPANSENDTLTISNVLGLDGYQYRICYTSPTCSTPVCSNGATLEVSGNVAFSDDPDDITVCSGSDTIFTATAAIPQGTFTFGWQYSDNNGTTWTTITFPSATFSHSITGAVASGTDVLTVTDVASMYNRRFRAVAIAPDCGSVFSDDARLSVQGPLSVSNHPDNVVECSGNATTFSATITNPGVPGSMIVNWQVAADTNGVWANLPNTILYNGTNTINQTSGVTTLSISNVAGLHNLYYRVAYRTSTCSVQYSYAARLVVEGPITVTTQPLNVDLCAGDAASFTSGANVGTAGTFAYQWQVTSDGTNWSDIGAGTDGGVYTGFNTTTLNVSNSTGLYSRCYRLAFSTGECNRVFSNAACLNIDGPISFTDHPDNIVQCSGEAVLFCATAITGSLEADSLTQIQWNWQENTGSGWADLQDDTLYNGVLTSCLSVAYTTNMDGNQYRAKIWTDNCDTVYSNAAFVDVEGPITVTDQPDNVTQCSGSGVSFTSTVAIQNGLLSSLQYNWEYSFNNGATWNDLVNGTSVIGQSTATPTTVTGANSTTVTISNVVGMYGYRFRMRYRTPTCNSAWTNYAQLRVEGPIAVTNHPDHVVECSGNAVNFAIQTSNTGEGAITYQWQVCVSGDSIAGPWINIPNAGVLNGAQTANLSISNVAGFNGYYYRALIQTSTCSSITSFAARLAVEGPISYTDHPDNITQCSGESVFFEADAVIAPGNVGTLIYQWQWSSDGVNYTNITVPGVNGFSGFNTDSLHIANVVGLDNRRFRLATRTGECNNIFSFPATLRVEGPLTINVNPVDFTNCSDKEAFFYSNVNNPAVGGEAAVFKQWQLSADNGVTWQNITQLTDTINGNIINFGGFSDDSLLIAPIIGLNGYLFRNIFWTETCNRDTTNAARLNVEGPITFTDQPDDVTLCAGQSTSFTIAIANSTGVGTVSYQWQRWTAGGWVNLSNAAPYSGAFTNMLSISDVSGLYNSRYRCLVRTGNCEWEISDQANLFVEGPITISLNLPDTAIVCSNRPYLFNTTVTNPGYGQMTFRWQYSTNSGTTWTNFPSNLGQFSSLGVVNPTDPNASWSGATGQDMNITNADGLNGWMFRLTITMPNCNDITNDAVLVVRDKCLSGLCDLDNDGIINNLDPDDDNDQVTDNWEQWMTDNNLIVNTDSFPGTGPWFYTVSGAAFPASPYISYNRCLVDTDGDGFYDNQEDPDGDNIQNGEETDNDNTFDGNPLDPCSPVLGPTCIGINLAIRVGLQGARIGVPSADTLMRDRLRSFNGAANPAPNTPEILVPFNEPYDTIPGFIHKNPTDGGGSEVITNPTATFAVTGPDAIVDWVFVELRSATALDSVATTRAGLLQRDGDVVDMDGVSNIRFPSASAGTFYVAVRHRNHLGVMSGEALELSPLLQVVDFTDPAYPTNGTYPQWVSGGKAYMWAGDLNSDGRTIYQGPGNDVLKLFTTVLYDDDNDTFIANFISEGYQRADVNLDGRAIYQGPGNDRSMLLLNAILSHPANVNLISNYVILEQLP